MKRRIIYISQFANRCPGAVSPEREREEDEQYQRLNMDCLQPIRLHLFPPQNTPIHCYLYGGDEDHLATRKASRPRFVVVGGGGG